MTSRERILKTLELEEPDRVPFDLGSTGNTGITMIAYNNLKRYLGIESETKMLNKSLQLAQMEEEILTRLEVDTRGIFLGESNNRREKIYEDGSYEDEWGVIRKKPESSYYYDVVKSPLEDEMSLKILDKYVLPNPNDPGRINKISERIKYLRDNTNAAIVLHIQAGFITNSQYIRGFENWLVDSALEPEILGELLDRTLQYQIDLTKAVLSAANGDVDVIHYGDDLGTQNGLMISPKNYRKIIKPRQAKLFANAKMLTNAKLLYHSCGSIIDIIDDLIEIGIDALNPVQYNTKGMKCEELKKRFGKRIAFWGSVDTNHILPCGSVADVREETKKRIMILGAGGGFVINPIHNIQPDVPPENILAMVGAINEYGKYPLI